MFTLKTVVSARVACPAFFNFIRHFAKDPGIGKRKKLLSSVNEQEPDIQDFDDLESDFMDVDKSYKEHLREAEVLKEREKYFIVRHKYFKEKFPNFLTWHDKEQIRYLYKTDPEEWTFDKLSEGFPALPETIKKIVKSNWTKNEQHKITNHDKSVQRNWELFKKGQISDLPPDLKEHLNKFTNRALNFNTFVAPDRKKQTFEVKNSSIKPEFSEIITSYEKMTKSSNSETEQKQIAQESLPKQPLEETYTTSSSRKSAVTFGGLQDKLQKKLETGKTISDEEKLIIMNLQPHENNDDVKKVTDEVGAIILNKYESSTAVQVHKKSERDYTHLNYPEKISIPKAIFKKGFIYKLNDCYYDDDGEFLYRVPGMG